MSRIIKHETSVIPEQGRQTIPLQQVEFKKEHHEEELVNETEASQLVLSDAEDQASRIVEQANSELEKTMAEINQRRAAFEEERMQLIEEAKQAGYQDGFQKGETDANMQYQSILDQANDIVSLAKQDYEEKIESSAEKIVELAFELAKRVWYSAEDTIDQFLALVKQVISEVKEYDDISIYVDPEHYDHVMEYKDELIRILQKDTHLAIYSDEKAPKGTCYVETSFGKVEASVDTQMNQLKEKLLEVIDSGDHK
ncbi:flagellar assembly protein FliH [Bacillus sp. LNXM12-2]|uniref:flagellar assembly protein FliH n=1 Tax=Bacillus TaxID=1386 RepID=UPI000D029ED1|nr:MULTISPECIES: flagellar assembly protein FliH [Bacillus]MCK6162330.1 flagellar assembly protein FliH [Bacillus pumilus]MCK6182836.1 flagellar assembly protein FliH [Bacillus pumilus]MDG4727791.1 flagellar assembly protein FliH [Bacillus pumilus]PRS53039.1 flagellar assembly protein FliH [Bacillus sp. GBSC66]PRS54531.1 flagellar assembly protein FliH [Bacillus sp. LNXM10]